TVSYSFQISSWGHSPQRDEFMDSVCTDCTGSDSLVETELFEILSALVSSLFMTITPQYICEQILELARKGLTPSQLCVYLRNLYNIKPVKNITVNKILRILKFYGQAPEIPEDLYHLIKKAVAVRKYLEYNHHNKDAQFQLMLIESRIH
ncbi:8860_t:CDS:2, partial [Racocetra persica]